MLFWKAIGVPALAATLLFGGVMRAQKKDPQQIARVQSALATLNLSEDQKVKLNPILTEQADKVRAARADASADKKGAARKVRDILAETEAKVKPILTDEQWTKFKELQEKARAEQKAKRKNK